MGSRQKLTMCISSNYRDRMVLISKYEVITIAFKGLRTIVGKLAKHCMSLLLGIRGL